MWQDVGSFTDLDYAEDAAYLTKTLDILLILFGIMCMMKHSPSVYMYTGVKSRYNSSAAVFYPSRQPVMAGGNKIVA